MACGAILRLFLWVCMSTCLRVAVARTGAVLVLRQPPAMTLTSILCDVRACPHDHAHSCRDEHYGELTVRETFQFSSRVQGGRRGECWGLLASGQARRWAGQQQKRRHEASKLRCIALLCCCVAHYSLHTAAHLNSISVLLASAERLLELEERERQLGIKSDPDLHAYMAALMTSGKEVGRAAEGVQGRQLVALKARACIALA